MLILFLASCRLVKHFAATHFQFENIPKHEAGPSLLLLWLIISGPLLLLSTQVSSDMSIRDTDCCSALMQDPDSSSLPDEDDCGEFGVSAVSPQRNGPLGARQGHRCTRTESHGEGSSLRRTSSSQSGL